MVVMLEEEEGGGGGGGGVLTPSSCITTASITPLTHHHDPSSLSETLLKVKQAFCSTAVDLPPEESTAPYHYIILPETFDLNETRKVLTVSTGFRIPIVSLVDSTMPSITTPRSPISSLPTITFSLFISSTISLPRPFFFIVLKEGEVEQ
ncbi:hypothetical protein G4B88_026486 [Cannabis sativa]|uniref:Uncharacterized protein n=1 Tax=Cannabis sativa TaxID=3483 RepID=A0A7J6GQL4_CANSA|nr:hypothetical protein G4B88_026486 [Cannabis sativa]